MPILDQYGHPLERSVLTEPQTSKLSQLRREFARHPSRGLTPAKLASILDGAEAGDLQSQAELFADMEEKDGHILAEMGKRKRALLTIPWNVVPPAGATAAEKALAEEVKEWLAARADLDDLIFDLMDAAGHAYSCVEIEWQRLGREWHPAKFCHRLPTWFQLDIETHSELRLRDQTGSGAVLQPFGWIVHIHKAKSGHIARAGLHRALAWPYLYKNYGVRDLAEFLEIYGLPVRLGKYPPGSGDTEKTTLLKAVVEIGHNAAGIIPDGMMIELLEAAKGTHEPFVAMFDWAERTESKVILGQVLSAEAKPTGLGSGVANLQSEVREDLKVSDARQLSDTLTRDVIYPWLAINRGLDDPRRAPRFQFDTQVPEDLTRYSEALPKLLSIGMKIPAAYVHERLKIPVAQDDEPVLTAPAPAPFPGGAPLRRRTAALRDAGDPPDAIDRMAEQLDAALMQAMTALVEPVRELAARANTIAELRDGLIDLYPALDPAAFGDLMTQALLASNLVGRFEVTDGR